MLSAPLLAGREAHYAGLLSLLVASDTSGTHTWQELLRADATTPPEGREWSTADRLEQLDRMSPKELRLFIGTHMPGQVSKALGGKALRRTKADIVSDIMQVAQGRGGMPRAATPLEHNRTEQAQSKERRGSGNGGGGSGGSWYYAFIVIVGHPSQNNPPFAQNPRRNFLGSTTTTTAYRLDSDPSNSKPERKFTNAPSATERIWSTHVSCTALRTRPPTSRRRRPPLAGPTAARQELRWLSSGRQEPPPLGRRWRPPRPSTRNRPTGRRSRPSSAGMPRRLAGGESSVILMHPPLPLAGVTTWMERGVSAKWQSRRRLPPPPKMKLVQLCSTRPERCSGGHARLRVSSRSSKRSARRTAAAGGGS